jgi:predicted ATPase
MIFEDAHWADPTSLELFSRVVERIAAVRVLPIVTFRPEFEALGSDVRTSPRSPSIGWRNATSTP